MTAALQAPVPVRSLALTGLPAWSPIAHVDQGLRLPATVAKGGHRFGVQLDLIDPAATVWRPRVREGGFPVGRPGIVLS